MEENMFDASGRPMGRLSCWVLAVVVALGLTLPAFGGAPVPQSGPGMTTVADTVYLADGTTARGNLIITWPAFMTASGTAVAAGTASTALGAGGALSVALVPNADATPAGVYYTIVYQIGSGQVKTEYWVVPTTSPANLATVRTTPGSSVAGQPVSLQYVNSELATKANDSAVVHLNGSETISGPKTFATAPSVPAPTSSGQVANKAYVDQTASTVGAGSYLSTAGGTMTGPITLPGAPVAAQQAATKQYVDTGLTTKGDLIAGLVPASELGGGAATAGSCLLGNGTASGTWGACGGGGGSGNVSTTPAASQNVAQPAGTQFSTNNLANIRYVTPSWNWSQLPPDSLSTAGTNTVHLSPCPLGVDTTANAYYSYKVYIAGTGTAEAAPVTGGSCTSGASSGTITVKTANAHAAGYTVGSASTGIQEAINDAWVSDGAIAPSGSTNASTQTAPYVKLESNILYAVYASVYLRSRGSILDGAGAEIQCFTRDRCVYVGTTQGSPYVDHHKLYNLTFTSTILVDGANVANVCAGASCSPAQSNGTYVLTTAATHPFLVGDTVSCEYYSQNSVQRWVSPVVSVPSSTSFTVAFGNGNFATSAATFGFCNIENAAIEVNSDHTSIQDLNLIISNPASFGSNGFGAFNYGVVNDNDQQLIIERAANRAGVSLNPNGNHAPATWPIGAFLYQRNDQGMNGITYLHNSEFSNVNCVTGGGNGLVFTDSVCQGFPLFGVRYFGAYQPLTMSNIYQESTGATLNGLYSAFPITGQMGVLTQGGNGAKIAGTFPIQGWTPLFANGGSAANQRNYFVVPRSNGTTYGPVLYVGSALPTSGSVSIPVQWPSVSLESYGYNSIGTLTWDVLETTGQATPPLGTGNFALATNISGSCGSNGMCSFTDTQATTSSYTVQPSTNWVSFWFWPANIAVNNINPVLMDAVGITPQVVSSQGMTGVSVIADQCYPGGGRSAWTRSPIWIECLAGPTGSGQGLTATVLQQMDIANNGPAVNSKGRLNFAKPIVWPNDLITLGDSNLAKTLTTAGERPLSDPGDMALGVDQSGGMTLRAGTSISSYINALPSGSNYQERLTGAAKTFNVPVTVNGNLSVAGGTVTLPVTGSGSQCLHVNSTGVVSGTGADCGSGSGSVTVNSGVTSQLAFYSGNGTVLGGDSALIDNGTTLNYTGPGGITASSGTFSGNLTVNGQLLVAGPWTVSSPVPGTAMAAAGTGNSSLGLSNDGNFYISANGGTPQKIATGATGSPFTSLWQEDANDVGAYNGTNPQGLHVYGTYTNASNFERTGLGWDATDGFFVVKNENAGTGQQHGIGFWIGSNVRWAIDTASAFKPFTNNAFDIGVFTTTSQLVPRTIYAGTSFDTLTQGRLNFQLCNDSGSGTALNFVAVYNGATPACAVKAGTSNTDGAIGIVSGGSGTSGNAAITYRGYVPCSFDGPTVAGDFVVASTTTAGNCHDAGATRPAGVQVLGRVESTNGNAGPWGMRASLEAPAGSGSGSVLANGTTATTQSAGDNSSKVATTAYVRNEMQMAWTCPVAGATTTGVSYCNWTVPANVTITQFELSASTAPAGCTTYPTLQVWDGRANGEVGRFSIAMTSGGANFYPVVTGSANVAQGEYLRVKVTTGGLGCGTVPAGVVATVTYQMQN
jgi:hypothetical protein